MQAVILAAGRGTRMGDLTTYTPKPLLKINGWPILEYTLANLPKEISEVIFIIGYQGHKIKDHFGASRGEKELRYVWQRRLDGTGGALWQIRKLLRGKFLVLNGDDLYHRDDLKKIIKHELAVLVKEVANPGEFGVIETDERGHLVRILEKPKKPKNNLVNAGVYILDKRIFDYPLVAISQTEFGLPQTMAQMAGQYKIKVERAALWHSNTRSDDLEKAREIIDKFFKL